MIPGASIVGHAFLPCQTLKMADLLESSLRDNVANRLGTRAGPRNITPLQKLNNEHAASVQRDQFGLSPQGIVHKPTDAAFTPDPTDPYSGIMRLGHLGNSHPNGGGFSPDEVCRLMNELWGDYVASNPKLFRVTRAKPN
jgi:hypothetical protein